MLYTIGLLPHALLGYDVFCVLEISLTSSVTCVILGSYCVVVVCPLGAQKEGAAGFFKGMGKGLVGAVARPTGGFIDMVSSTFQGIKRCVCVCVCVCVSIHPRVFPHFSACLMPSLMIMLGPLHNPLSLCVYLQCSFKCVHLGEYFANLFLWMHLSPLSFGDDQSLVCLKQESMSEPRSIL